MRVKVILNTVEPIEDTARFVRTSQEVWIGEIDIPQGVLVAKLSIIGEGETHPIVDIPFSLSEGHWRWIPGDPDDMFGALISREDVEKITGMAFDQDGKRIQQ